MDGDLLPGLSWRIRAPFCTWAGATTCAAKPARRPSCTRPSGRRRRMRSAPNTACTATTRGSGYRRFLARLVDPLRIRLAPAAQGWTTAAVRGRRWPRCCASEAGHPMRVWDPSSPPDPTRSRAATTSSPAPRVVEHFHAPAAEFARLDGLLRPGAGSASPPACRPRDARFAAWHYWRDPTHVVFHRGHLPGDCRPLRLALRAAGQGRGAAA